MKKIVNTILISFLLLYCGNIWAQKEQVLCLKNGSEIKGELIDSTDTGVKIKQKDGSVWFFESDKIARIKSYVPKVSGSGMFVRAGLGVLGGTEVSPILQITNGYTFNSHWDAGIGFGVEYLWGDGYIPVFLTTRYNLSDRYFTPYVEVYSGYDVPMRDWQFNKGGLISGGRLGITKYISDRIGFSTSLGYRYAYLKRENTWWDDFDTFTHIHRFELAVALTFK